MDSTPDSARDPAHIPTRAVSGPLQVRSDPASLGPLERRLGRVIFLSVLATATVLVLIVEAQQRGALERDTATRLGQLAEVAAAAVAENQTSRPGGNTVDLTSDGAALPTALGALVALPGIARVTLFLPGGVEPCAFDRDGPVEAKWRKVTDVPRGQGLLGDHVRVLRDFEPEPGQLFTVVVEGRLDVARAMIAEGFGALLRAMLGVLLVSVAVLPRLVRRLTAPWRSAVALLQRRASGEGDSELDLDPTLSLEAIERQYEKRIAELQAQLDRDSRTSGVDERHQAPAAQLDARAERLAYLSNTGHELRTPLQAVVATGALLLETELDPEQHALVNRIVVAADALTDSVQDLTELASLESGTFEPVPAIFRPEDLMEDLVEIVTPLARDREVELLSRLQSPMPDSLRGDARRIRRIALHLLDNALRHTEKGLVDLRMGVATSEAGTELWIEVHDTGSGISRAQQVNLLDDLAAISHDERGLRGGIGVGLSLAARLARGLGGSLEFESALLAGSVFRVQIPIDILDDTAVVRTQLGRRALVLDDDPKSLEHLVGLLRDEGLEVEAEATAYAGFEALSRGGDFDFVLIDAQLAGRDPFLGGVETMPRQGEPPRIVLVHPILGRTLPERSLDDAVAAQLAKPITRRTLRRVLELAQRGHNEGDDEGPDSASKEAGTEPRGRAPESRVRTAGGSRGAREIRVLLVDDNEQNRQLVQFVLTKRGYTVEVACDGRAAVDAFALGEFDIVLMDCQMPGMDGFEATRQIRRLERGRERRVPVLALSAGGLGDGGETIHGAGMDDFLAKPFQPRDLLAWVEGWVTQALRHPRGAVTRAPRRRVTAREVGLAQPEGGGPQSVKIAASGPQPRQSAGSDATVGALDRTVLGPLLEDAPGRTLANELVEAFLESGPKTVEQLVRLLSAEDFAEAARIAHRFVSTSGSVGAMRLARTMREAEVACERFHHASAKDLVARASQEFEGARRALAVQLARA